MNLEEFQEPETIYIKILCQTLDDALDWSSVTEILAMPLLYAYKFSG
jgi:hypothetical protein